MSKIRNLAVGILASTFLASGAMATDTALIVMNQDYRYMPDTPRHSVVDRLVRDLKNNDFNVIFGRNAWASGLVNLAKSTRASLEKGDRLIVFCPGNWPIRPQIAIYWG